ncbi:hypothetical protein M011DRAFT_431650 [Sporormia fimetaria CBS 119925]|uniref:Subtilisin-like serine protease n=1 Tax=Sporormia fimetaria CBS 119925 TaxID=1340428 RepID=A0A6A6V204_9PLEO|nr:hypothetical protein M011DRAFT_431650 [Sporormia fimetaria CBS 119925]
MAPHLWIMTTYNSGNINPLHRQRVKDREIIITEDPRLHLVWIRNRVFVKPLPRYLCSHAFWDAFLETPGVNKGSDKDPMVDVRKAATGFLRTYLHLVKYESDFRIAQEQHLIPTDTTWEKFCQFISSLQNVDDTAVSQRYHYGELRLTRLNFYAPFLIRRFHYEQVHGQYGDFFGRLFAPMLFVFALVSTLLSSMQVLLGVEQLIDDGAQWMQSWHVYRWISLVSLVGAGLVSLSFAALWSYMVLDEWIFTLRRKIERQRNTRMSSKC